MPANNTRTYLQRLIGRVDFGDEDFRARIEIVLVTLQVNNYGRIGRSDDFLFFFFSSRRRHTRYWRDWSSDVCSSDLLLVGNGIADSGELVIRRVQGRDGRTRSFVNGEPVSPSLLGALGSSLVEIHGQQIGRASCRERV